MKNIRVIARLDIKGPNLVKGIHLEGLRVLGKPEHFAQYYYENGADELLYVDTVASLYGRNSLHEIITKTARKAFIPLTVGGGLRSVEDIRNVLRAGADKVSINTGAIRNPEVIKQASRKFGSSTLVVAIEAIKQPNGNYQAFIDNGREYTGIEVIQWAQKVEELGAGEILITSVDREGSALGYDLELTRMVSQSVSIPVIAHGGAGKKEHIVDVIQNGHADAVAVASIIHYDAIMNNRFTIPQEEEGNIEFLKNGKISSKIEPASIFEIKKHMHTNAIPCRNNLKELVKDESI